MKVTVKENETFTPIKIELVIESKEELLNLWARMASEDYDINEHICGNLANESDNQLFVVLDDIKIKKGL